jgi:hypothetical protein
MVRGSSALHSQFLVIDPVPSPGSRCHSPLIKLTNQPFSWQSFCARRSFTRPITSESGTYKPGEEGMVRA